MNANASRKVRGLGLCSGGLDSILAALVLREQGIAVEWITFETPFFTAQKAKRAARMTGIDLTVLNITPTYLAMLRNPNCGYGQCMNPCLDCHALMFKLAGRLMQEKKFDFLFSGEVLGQRPMSQTRNSMRYVEKNSGYAGYILRPLSARKLPETLPEKNGLVNRNRLLDLSGRGRKPQMALAQKFGITDYPAPAGGCLLTDKGYSRRLKDLFQHQDQTSENDLHLLRYGRHFRLKDNTKLIVGRTRKDNEAILEYWNPQADTAIRVKNYQGPVGLVPGGCSRDALMLAASICAGYSKAPHLTPAHVILKNPDETETVVVLALPPSDVKRFLI
jgi:hypothetical protein